MALELSSSSSSVPNSDSKATGVAAEKLVASSPSKYKKHLRVPKKIHKSEREKLKREQLNDLFLDLGQTLEPTRQNNSKASILNDAIKLLRELIAQVATLRKEHFSLLNESNYVTREKEELVDENNAFTVEIQKIRTDMSDRMQPDPAWRAGEAIPSLSQQAPTPSSIQQPPHLGPLVVIPLGQDPLLACSLPSHGDEQAPVVPKLASPPVRRPHARYPTSTDSWTLEILTRQQGGVSEGGGPLVAGNGEEEGTGRRFQKK